MGVDQHAVGASSDLTLVHSIFDVGQCVDTLISSATRSLPREWPSLAGQLAACIERLGINNPVAVAMCASDFLRRLCRSVSPSISDPEEALAQSLADLITQRIDVPDFWAVIERWLTHELQSSRRDSLIETVNAQRVAAYIEQHLDQTLTLHSIAKVTGWSSANLTRQFRRAFSTTVRQYVVSARMARAKSLLAADDKIDFVMTAVGYHNRTAFYAAFRRVFGISPGHFQPGRTSPLGGHRVRCQ